MSVKLGIVMDPIESIIPYKDTTLAIMLAAQKRDWEIYYLQQRDLWLTNGEVWGRVKKITVHDDNEHWFDIVEEQTHPLAELDLVLMRKDPPFDTEYIYTTYLLELAEAAGLKVYNKPQSLRDANEKLFTGWFPQCTPPSLVSRDADLLRQFIAEHTDSVLKPLHGMGGGSIFKLHKDDPNINVVIETLTNNGSAYIMAQQFLPEIFKTGDKRIIMINGEPIPYALARMPAGGDIRGNLAAGGQGHGVELNERDRWICAEVGPTLREKELMFVGLDVIGDYLTEINVTSPTCVRELEAEYKIDICGQLLDQIASGLD